MIVADLPPLLLRVFSALFGLFFGSFLNVVIARVPRGESIAFPGSHCVCGKPIAWYDNVPIVSWLVLRGRARCCGAKISVRYPLVEAIGGALALAILEVDVLAHADMLFTPLLFRAIADLALSLALVAAAFIDLDHMYLPDPITIGGAVFALATAVLRPELGALEDGSVSTKQAYAHAAFGMMIGFWTVYLPFIVLYRVLRGRAGMGLGDAKLLALFGAWFGWQGAVFALFAGALQGTLAAIVTLLRKGKIDEPEAVTREREEALAAGAPLDPEADPLALPPDGKVMTAQVAFGPFLILAGLEWLLFGREIVQRWVPLFVQ